MASISVGCKGASYLEITAPLKRYKDFPLEVIGIMLFHAFGCFSLGPKLYNHMRSTVRLVCRAWNRMVQGAGYWSSIYISLTTSIENIHLRFDRALARPVSVCFDFVDYNWLENSVWTPGDARPTINAAFGRLAATANCVELYVNSFTRRNSAIIAAHVARVQSPTLRTLKAAVNPYTPDGASVLLPGISTFNNLASPLPSLKRLHVQGAFPQWQHGRPYALVQKLTLNVLKGNAALTWFIAYDLFSNMPLLTDLRLEKVDCRDFPLTKSFLPEMRLETPNHLVGDTQFRLQRTARGVDAHSCDQEAPSNGDERHPALPHFDQQFRRLEKANTFMPEHRMREGGHIAVPPGSPPVFNVSRHPQLPARRLQAAVEPFTDPSAYTHGGDRCHDVSFNDLNTLVTKRQAAIFHKNLVVCVAGHAKFKTVKAEWVNVNGEMQLKNKKKSLATMD
ncbi:hypothetical protein DFH06DRAFT_1145108 [Mycena polygramma]|nr:hypothetical protein DFH06DRAFT_1145108 [Mycena polygramma]